MFFYSRNCVDDVRANLYIWKSFSCFSDIYSFVGCAHEYSTNQLHVASTFSFRLHPKIFAHIQIPNKMYNIEIFVAMTFYFVQHTWCEWHGFDKSIQCIFAPICIKFGVRDLSPFVISHICKTNSTKRNKAPKNGCKIHYYDFTLTRVSERASEHTIDRNSTQQISPVIEHSVTVDRRKDGKLINIIPRQLNTIFEGDEEAKK